MDEQDRPIDLSPLDPTVQPRVFDRIVAAIGEQAQPELARRRAASSALVQVARWRRPMLLAAAVAAIISFTVLSQMRPMSSGSDEMSEFSEAIGVPQPIAQWLGGEQHPPAAALLFAYEESQ